MEPDMEKDSDPKAFTFDLLWDLKTSLGWFDEPKSLGKRLTKPLVENPSSNIGPHFFPELWDEFNKIIKSQKKIWSWDLGPRNHILATWAQKMYLAINPEPWLQF